MKFIFLVLLSFLLILSVQNSVEAHSGRTDSSGGHNCSAKSKAKGLCTGYHYHNGGGTSSSDSSSDSSTPSPSIQSTDKDCPDFSNYDEVVAYWNARGYTKDYDPERLDGFGNVVDDGVPCEPPENYDLAKVNGSPAQVAQDDQAKGEKDGYSIGIKDGYAEQERQQTPNDGTEAYIKGYEKGYSKGYSEGTNKITSEKDDAVQAGYALGIKEKNLEIPKIYGKNDVLKSSFEEGFNRARKEIVKEREDKYEAQGYEDGKNDKKQTLTDIKEDNYLSAYKAGFEKGQKQLKKSYIEQGYNDAFKMIEYKSPSFPKDKYNRWYKEGFNSNEKILEIQDTAYEMGLSGEELNISDKFEGSEKVFKHYFKIGTTEYSKIQGEKTTQSVTAFGIVVFGWLARRFYVARKMIA